MNLLVRKMLSFTALSILNALLKIQAWQNRIEDPPVPLKRRECVADGMTEKEWDIQHALGLTPSRVLGRVIKLPEPDKE